MAAPNQITPAQLSRLIGTPDCPVIVDVRIDEDFAQDPRLIPTAFRHAHTDTLSKEPEAAGLLAASLGLSRMYRDDLEQLDAGMALYDAFYRWARDATGETHIWQEKDGGK